MTERKTLREILVGHVGEDGADRIVQELESLAKAGASGLELEYALRKDLAEIMFGRRAAAIGIGIAIGVGIGTGISAGVGITVGNRLTI